MFYQVNSLVMPHLIIKLYVFMRVTYILILLKKLIFCPTLPENIDVPFSEHRIVTNLCC